MTSAATWIWRQAAWPAFTYDAAAAGVDLTKAHLALGRLSGMAASIGLEATNQATVASMVEEAMATSAIEGERLPLDVVRSSVMRRLGHHVPDPGNRSVDGLVEVLNDASGAWTKPLDADRLCRWQSALFPGGTSGIRRIAVGRFRDHADPMQIVSGLPGREVVHYVAPASSDVPTQMERLLAWFNDTSPSASTGKAARSSPQQIDGLARAAIVHLWFEAIHPFEDGNGRIGRAIVDMAISQHLGHTSRLLSLSHQLLKERKAYYDALNVAQLGPLDVTPWVSWFAQQCAAACEHSQKVINEALLKDRFWAQHAASGLNDRQRKVLQRLLDDGDGGFLGGLNAEKYMKMTGASKATATRDLGEMVANGQLWHRGAGKGIRYYVAVPGWTHGVAEAANADVKVARSLSLSPSLGGGVLQNSVGSRSRPKDPEQSAPAAELSPKRGPRST